MEAKSNRKKIIGWVVTLALVLLVAVIPTTEVYTLQIKIFMMITVAGIMSLVFELLIPTVPAILMPCLYVITGLVDTATAFKGWTGEVVWCSFACFLIANMLTRTGLLKRIANKCIIITGASYTGIIFGIFIGGIVLSVISGGSTSMTFAYIAFGYGVCQALGLKKSRASAGIMISSCVSMMMSSNFIYTPASYGVMFGAVGESLARPSYMEFLVQNWVLIPLNFIVAFVIAKTMKPETPINGKDYFVSEQKAMGKMSKDELKMVIMLVLILAMLLLEKQIGINYMYAFLAVPFLFFLPGLNVGKFEDIKNIKFETVVFVAGFMSVGTVARSVGIADLVTTVVMPLLTSSNVWIIVAIFWLLGFLINFLLTPLAAMTALSAPIASIATNLGLNPTGILYAFAHGLDNLLMPYERSIYLACYGYDMIELKYFAKVMGYKAIIGFIYIMAICVPYWKLIGLL